MAMLSCIKRPFDAIASLLGLVGLSPLFAIIALLIKKDSPGPVFYRGLRLGKDGRLFHMLKFRTMYETPESYLGPRLTAGDDPRITPTGHILRCTKLNELPQLWNVLKGDMSLVGPRPEDPALAAQWLPEVRAEILSVCPGVTSPASIQFRDEEQLLSGSTCNVSRSTFNVYTYEILPAKQRLDLFYVRHHTFWLDLEVLARTFLVLLPRLRAKAVLSHRDRSRKLPGPWVRASLSQHREPVTPPGRD